MPSGSAPSIRGAVAGVVERAEQRCAPGNRRDVITAGLTLRPIPEIAVKFDYQHFWTDAGSDAEIDSYNVGLGFMF